MAGCTFDIESGGHGSQDLEGAVFVPAGLDFVLAGKQGSAQKVSCTEDAAGSVFWNLDEGSSSARMLAQLGLFR